MKGKWIISKQIFLCIIIAQFPLFRGTHYDLSGHANIGTGHGQYPLLSGSASITFTKPRFVMSECMKTLIYQLRPRVYYLTIKDLGRRIRVTYSCETARNYPPRGPKTTYGRYECISMYLCLSICLYDGLSGTLNLSESASPARLTSTVQNIHVCSKDSETIKEPTHRKHIKLKILQQKTNFFQNHPT